MGTTSGDDAVSVSELEQVEPKAASNAGDSAGGGVIEKKRRILLPSERYPNLPLVERETELLEKPSCECCGTQMVDSGMTEDVEYLEKVPATYQVIREKKHKYSCKGCQGFLKTTPALPRIKPGSAYSDG